jgi:hypothetical protein
MGSSSGADRPLRAQVIVALVCVAMLIAVPLYLWRKPSTQASGAAAGAASSASASAGPTPPPRPSSEALPAATPPRITLGPIQKVRCGASASSARNEGSMCDTLAPFEEALKKAILESEGCAPKSGARGTINYVLTVDFPRKKLHVYPGASGEWRGRQARRATTCVAKAVTVADWNVPHQYRFYAIAVLATYAGPAGSLPAPGASSAPALPSFE